jgi:myo-inositol-1(or 4)-monophosphatase
MPQEPIDRNLADSLRQVVLQAGVLAKEHFSRFGTLETREKAPKDLVTEADIKIEEFIKKSLEDKYPHIGFWGEETGENEIQENRWIVDPIDGTHSFSRGQIFWSISIALQIAGEIRLGAVYAPALDELYFAEKGDGAWKNGKQIHVSSVNSLGEAMVCTGFACLRSNLENNNLERFTRIALQTRDQRRLGSAALEICMVADGRLDAFWEQNLNLFDIAAGALIASEAGANVCSFSGKSGVFPEEILVTNGLIDQEILALM